VSVCGEGFAPDGVQMFDEASARRGALGALRGADFMNLLFPREHCMSLALAEALAGRAKREGGPFGAVVARNSEIIAARHNTVLATNDPTAHAEINAIRAACEKLGRLHLDDCVLHTTCEPCPMCLGAIYWARLKAVYYAADRHDAADAGFGDAEFYGEFAKPADARQIPFGQIMQREAVDLMRSWDDPPLYY
jgi:tRNA(Arg) A34 adenosine deaminase TadA